MQTQPNAISKRRNLSQQIELSPDRVLEDSGGCYSPECELLNKLAQLQLRAFKVVDDGEQRGPLSLRKLMQARRDGA
jgi:hypothetical protein